MIDNDDAFWKRYVSSRKGKTLEIEYMENEVKTFQYFTNCRCIPKVIHNQEWKYNPEHQGCWK